MSNHIDEYEEPESPPRIVRWQRWTDLEASGLKMGKHWHRVSLLLEIEDKGYRFGSDWHMFGTNGVPVFDDGRVLQLDELMWSEYMAEAWNLIDKPRHYGRKYFMYNQNIGYLVLPPGAT